MENIFLYTRRYFPYIPIRRSLWWRKGSLGDIEISFEVPNPQEMFNSLSRAEQSFGFNLSTSESLHHRIAVTMDPVKKNRIWPEDTRRASLPSSLLLLQAPEQT